MYSDDDVMLCYVITQCLQLSKLEIGGNFGKILTAAIQQIHSDFIAAVVPYKREGQV
jgi:hypothetical protein